MIFEYHRSKESFQSNTEVDSENIDFVIVDNKKQKEIELLLTTPMVRNGDLIIVKSMSELDDNHERALFLIECLARSGASIWSRDGYFFQWVDNRLIVTSELIASLEKALKAGKAAVMTDKKKK